MVLTNVLLFLFLVGSWAYTEQQTRVLDDDTVQSCMVALDRQRAREDEYSWDYDAADPRFGGPNVLAVDVVLDGRTREVRCAVASTGDTVDDPLSVTSVEVLG
jgi:hypothetical protein